MPAPKVKADFDQLGQIAGTFSQSAQNVRQTTQNVQSRMQTLQNGDWVGDSANTFYAEMQDVVLPALKRLSEALQEANRVVMNIRQTMEQAERDAAAVFTATPDSAPNAGDGGILGAIGNAIGDFVSGVIEEGKGMVEGIVNMVAHPIQTLEGLAFAVTHPDKLWDALTKPYVDDWNSGHPWKAIGRGALNVALLIGTAGIGEAGAAAGEGANAAGKLGEVAGAASKLGEVGEAGETATLAARTAEAAELARSAEVAEVARGAELAEAARGAEISEAVRGSEAGILAKEGIPEAKQIFEGFEPRSPQRALDNTPGSKLTAETENFVTPGKHGDFNAYEIGIPGDKDTKLLWTIDDDGAHFVKEDMYWDSSREMPSHTNISDTAYFAGEAWRTGNSQMTINASSRAFGYNWQVAKELTGDALNLYKEAMQGRYDNAVKYFEQLGIKVEQLPFR